MFIISYMITENLSWIFKSTSDGSVNATASAANTNMDVYKILFVKNIHAQT